MTCDCRENVGELLSQVCSGVGTEEMTAALQGLLAAAAHVRAAAIAAMLDVPAFAEGAHPSSHTAHIATLCSYQMPSIQCGSTPKRTGTPSSTLV